MQDWLIFLGAAGFVYVLTQGVITTKIRAIYLPLLGCPMCSGVWVGWMAGAYLALRDGAPRGWLCAAIEIFASGFIVSLLASAAAVLLCTAGSHKLRGRMIVKQVKPNQKKVVRKCVP